ncbi:protein FAM234B [Papilio machaon]|uniref:protein FAM234B n=1 Tax=Papilio machaon TaxID=76193 RepID=UPI001E66440F|nr:protein FAM234B [Papilio machaon]
MSANGNGANYAPLKQTLSDTESEDDQKGENAVRIRATDSCNNLEYNSGLQSSKNYSNSDMDDLNTNANTLESTMDNVSFLQSDASNKMSLPRRCAFVASIFLCIFTVIFFLWGIPCSNVGNCQNNQWRDKSAGWELPYYDLELSGAIQVVNGAVPKTKNLIFIYRGNHMKHEGFNNNDNVNGVLLIVGNTGEVGWFTREKRIPTQINCNLIDVNKDRQKDCLVAGTEGLLATLNALSGTHYWHVNKNGNISTDIAAIDFPIIVNDTDSDGVLDLLTIGTVYPNTNHNELLLISGANGNIIGGPLIIPECTSVKLLPEATFITYLCKNGPAEAVRQILYPHLLKKLSANHGSDVPIPKKANLSLKKNIGNTRNVFSNGPGKLIVENEGECPNSCRVNLTLVLEQNGTNNVTWEYTANHVFAMTPSSFSFPNSIRGFVLKL